MQETKTMEKLKLMSRMEFMLKGEDFLFELGAKTKQINKVLSSMNELCAKKVAVLMNLPDYKPLLSPKTRTAEQNELMLKLSAYITETNMKTYLASDYHKTNRMVFNEGLTIIAEDVLADLKRNNPEKTEIELFQQLGNDTREDIENALAWINVSFYVKHGELDPKAHDAISEEQLDELRQTMRDCLVYHKTHGGGYLESVQAFFGDPVFTRVAERITEISQDEFFNQPLSKAWGMQNRIAQEGLKGFDLNVGNKTQAGQVYILTTIADKDGKQLKIDELCKGVQRAVGNLLDEARAQGISLPIYITPQQIYRAFARLHSNAEVMDNQAAEMEEAMDILMFATSEIDFKVQLEKHKKIKQQNDYDYTGPEAGTLKGVLVPAVKLENFRWKNGTILPCVYEISSYPILYRYSHIVGQMARIPNELLRISEKPAIKESKLAGTQATARSIAVRQNLLERVLRMEERAENDKSFTNIIKTAEVAADCGITLTEKSERTLLKNIGLYLEELRLAKKIKAFTKHKTGRKIDGFQISI